MSGVRGRGIPGVGSRRSDRIDTTVTLVRVRRGDDSSPKVVAANYVRKRHQGAEVLNVWSERRHTSGDLIWAVEWADPEHQS